MFNKKRMGLNNFNSNPNFNNTWENSFPNNFDIERLKTEINELKRNQMEMLNRITRMENYLGVRNELSSNQNNLY